jgi:hypothetical protein
MRPELGYHPYPTGEALPAHLAEASYRRPLPRVGGVAVAEAAPEAASAINFMSFGALERTQNLLANQGNAWGNTITNMMRGSVDVVYASVALTA